MSSELAGEVLAGPGAPDVLVNNAGAGRWRAIDETEPGEAAQAVALPYLAAFELTRALVPAMIARGSGHILNMTSGGRLRRSLGANAYGVARWAMRAFSYQLTDDLRGTGESASRCWRPSEVDSPYFDNNPGSQASGSPGSRKLIGTIEPRPTSRPRGGARRSSCERRQRARPLARSAWLLPHHAAARSCAPLMRPHRLAAAGYLMSDLWRESVFARPVGH